MDEVTRFALSINEAEGHTRRARELIAESGRRLALAEQMAHARRMTPTMRQAYAASAANDWELSPTGKELRDAIAARWGATPRSPNSFYLDAPIARRTLTAGSDSAGGYAVESANMLRVVEAHDTAGGMLALMNIVTAAGASGNQAIGKFASLPTSYVLADESTSITEVTPEASQSLLVPRNICTFGMASRPWVLQSEAGAAANARLHLAALRSRLLQQIAEGSGSNNEMTGLRNHADVPRTDATTATWAMFVAAMADVEGAGGGPFAWCVSASAAEVLRQRAGVSGVSAIMADNSIGGYPAFVVGASTNPIAIFGSWSDLFVYQWAPPEIALDPYGVNGANFVSQVIGVRGWLTADAAPMLPASFHVLHSIS